MSSQFNPVDACEWSAERVACALLDLEVRVETATLQLSQYQGVLGRMLMQMPATETALMAAAGLAASGLCDSHCAEPCSSISSLVLCQAVSWSPLSQLRAPGIQGPER